MRNPVMADVHTLRREIEVFANINPEMNATAMLIFLFIAQRGLCTQKDVEIKLGLTRAVSCLSESGGIHESALI
jgi:hypothetical protein